MKRIINNIALIFLGIAIFSSCAKQLNQVPVNSITFGNIESDRDMQSLLNQVAWYTRAIQYGNENLYPVISGSYADELASGFVDYRDHKYSETFVFWSRYYEIIAQANVALSYIDKIDLSQERKDYYKGMLLFYKAYTYSYLIKVIGDSPLVLDDVPVQNIARAPWTQVALYAIGLLNEAVELLPNIGEGKDASGAPLNERHNITKGAAYAVLADLASWYAGGKYMAIESESNYDENEYWKIAEDACTKIIEDTKNYSLGSVADVCTALQTTRVHSESVWEVAVKDYWVEAGNPIPAYVVGCWYHSFPVNTTKSYTDIKYAWFRIKEETVKNWYKVGDARRTEFFWDVDNQQDVQLSVDIDTGEPIMGKRNPDDYNGLAYPYKIRESLYAESGDFAGEFSSFNGNKILYRLADIILLRAEARARQGKTGEAIADLNLVRDRAGADLYSASEFGGDLQMAIFKEREKELVMEGKRYYDIIRNGKEYVRTQLSAAYTNLTDQDFKDGALTVPVHSYQFDNAPLLRQTIYWHRKLN